jgi:hypothetical protein
MNGFEALTAASMKNSSIFWDLMPCRACCLPHDGFLFRLLLKTEEVYSSEISVHFYRNIRRYIPEDRTLQNECKREKGGKETKV